MMLFKGARKSKTPYIVQQMSVTEFIDFREMAKTAKSMSVDVDGEKVKWSLVKQLIAYGHDKDALHVTMTTANQRNELTCQAGIEEALGNVTRQEKRDTNQCSLSPKLHWHCPSQKGLSPESLQRALGATKI